VAWTVFVVITLAVLVMLGSQVWGLLKG